MRSILEELWYGNVCTKGGCRELTPEVKQLMKYIADHHDNLMETMIDEQKDIFERFDDCWSEYASLAERSIFIYAFKLGMQLAIEVLSTDT